MWTTTTSFNTWITTCNGSKINLAFIESFKIDSEFIDGETYYYIDNGCELVQEQDTL